MTSEESKVVDGASTAVAVETNEDAAAEQQTAAEIRGEQPVSGEAADALKKAEFQPVSESHPKGAPVGMDLLLDVTLPISIELGRTVMCVKEILSICEGSVIELERLAGEPVDIMVGGRLLGKGEVVVMNDRFGVRITELVNPIEGVAKA
jgi:flagellar motor switch protein FliN/FliY